MTATCCLREIEFKVKCVPMNKYVLFLRNVDFLSFMLAPSYFIVYSGFLEIMIKFQGRDMQSFRSES